MNESYLREMRSTEDETNCATSASSSFLTTKKISFIDTLFELSNNYFKILRVFPFIRRFIYNCRNTVKKKGLLTCIEIKDSENVLIRASQVSLDHKMSHTVNISSLNPFIDQDRILRVGGRL